MVDSIYHMKVRKLRNLISGAKGQDFVIIYETLLWTSFHNATKICKPHVAKRH